MVQGSTAVSHVADSRTAVGRSLDIAVIHNLMVNFLASTRLSTIFF